MESLQVFASFCFFDSNRVLKHKKQILHGNNTVLIVRRLYSGMPLWHL